MRFSIDIYLQNELISKEKDKMILNLMKKVISKDEELFERLYGNIKTKQLTYSLYLGRNVRFLRDYIQIMDKKIILNLSTSDVNTATRVLGCFIEETNNKFKTKCGNFLRIGRSNILEERVITSHEVFRTMSPVCIREHTGDNKTTYYHSWNKEGKEVLMRNLQNRFGSVDISIKFLEHKEVKVKRYGIVVPAILGKVEIEGDKLQIEDIYMNGIGSYKSSGFGMLG